MKEQQDAFLADRLLARSDVFRKDYPGMTSKPLIGINADFRAGQGSQPGCTAVAAGYYDAIAAAGGVPIILPPIDDLDAIGTMLENLQGIVLTGGADLDPRNDGFMLHPSVRPMDERRERFDRMLMREVAERRLPLFAIGVGMQLLNVSLGGNLFLHIPEDLPSAIPHKDPQDPNHRHTLVVESDSLVGRIYGEGEIRVTSRHHMAIDQLAEGFRVTARCPDGIIEAIESEMIDWFVLATQFHPESTARSALDIRLFEDFVEAVKQRSGQLRLIAQAA